MAIQDEMFKMIEKEIDSMSGSDELVDIDVDVVKEVAKMLTGLSTGDAEADTLTNQYIAGIKNICNSKKS